MKLALQRDYMGSDCVQGILTMGGHSWHTMERPWIPIDAAPCGKKGESCIPAGNYSLELHNSEKHPHSFALVNHDLWVYHRDSDVPAERLGIARTLVLIHSANWASQLNACIALGEGRAALGGKRMVTESRQAMAEFNALLPWTVDLDNVIEITDKL